MKARQAARGRRAHQMWSVEMWPCRTFFSRREWAETSSSGNATSISRLRRSATLSLLGDRKQLVCADFVLHDALLRLNSLAHRVLDDPEFRGFKRVRHVVDEELLAHPVGRLPLRVVEGNVRLRGAPLGLDVGH